MLQLLSISIIAYLDPLRNNLRPKSLTVIRHGYLLVISRKNIHIVESHTGVTNQSLDS